MKKKERIQNFLSPKRKIFFVYYKNKIVNH
jgi:hypothetical protein